MKRTLGAIRKKKPGVWEVSCENGYHPDGRRKRATRVVRGNRNDAEQALAVLLVKCGKAYNNGELSDDVRHITVRSFFEDIYLDDVRKQKEADILAPSTFAGYETNVKLHISPSPFGDTLLTDLTAMKIKQHFMSITPAGAAKSSWKIFRQGIHYALDDCNLLPFNPLPSRMKLPSVNPYVAETFTADEMRELLAIIRGHWLEPWVLVSFGLGLRRGESCALWWGDIDLTTGVVSINKSLQYLPSEGKFERDRTKTAKSNRKVVLPEFIRLRLIEINGTDLFAEGPLVPSLTNPKERMNPDSASYYYSKFLEDNGFKKVPISNLRHTHGTIAQLNGAGNFEISNTQGRTELKTDYKHYIGQQTEQSRAVAQVIDSVISNG